MKKLLIVVADVILIGGMALWLGLLTPEAASETRVGRFVASSEFWAAKSAERKLQQPEVRLPLLKDDVGFDLIMRFAVTIYGGDPLPRPEDVVSLRGEALLDSRIRGGTSYYAVRGDGSTTDVWFPDLDAKITERIFNRRRNRMVWVLFFAGSVFGFVPFLRDARSALSEYVSKQRGRTDASGHDGGGKPKGEGKEEPR